MSHLSLETLARLVDEPADAAERAHLEACPACRRELEDLRADVAALHALPPIDPPIAAWPKIENRLAGEGLLRRPRVTMSWRAAGLRAAAAIVFFMLGGAAGAAWMGERPDPRIIATGPASPVLIDPRILPAPSTESERETRPAAPPSFDTRRQEPGVLPVTDNVLAAALLSGRMPQTRDEASVFLGEAEALYMTALDRLANLGPDAFSGDPMTRIAALEGIVAITRTALERAPADPVLNGYHITAIAQREAALRQIAAAARGNWF